MADEINITFTETLEQFLKRIREEDEVDLEDRLRFLNPDPAEQPFVRPIIMENGARIWGYCTIAPTAKIGKNVTIGAFTNICGNAVIGDYTRMQGFNYIPQGVTIGERVFIGPNVTFTNVRYPTVRMGDYSWERVYDKTIVEDKASIGAGCIICPGVRIGKFAMIGAGSVVTGDVLPGWLVKGNPARHIKLFIDPEKAALIRPLDGKDHGWDETDNTENIVKKISEKK